MPYTRRALLKSLPSVVGLSALRTAQTGGSRDPLGVRVDFAVADRVLFLNSAYITPTPSPVVAAGREFADAKGSSPIALGDMLSKTDAVRAQYARLINASPDEIGFLSATSEGENILGRSGDAQVCLDMARVSRQHARIVVTGRRVDALPT